MDPQKPQYTIDYLDQIAPKKSSSAVNNKLFFGVIGLGILLVIGFAILLIVGGGGPSQTSRIESMAARLQALQQISSDASNSITDNQLQSINASLTTQLSSINQAMTDPLAKVGVKADKLPKSIQSKESLSSLQDKLADAKLNAVYDRTYANDMSYQLSDLFILMREINNGTKSSSMHSFLTTTSDNLAPIASQLSTFTDAGTN